MSIQQLRTRSGKNTYYRYRVKNHETDQEETLCGKELYWDNMYHPSKKNYEGIKGLAPDLSMGIKGKNGLYHLSCLCKEHAEMLDRFFIRKLKKGLIDSGPAVSSPSSGGAVAPSRPERVPGKRRTCIRRCS